MLRSTCKLQQLGQLNGGQVIRLLVVNKVVRLEEKKTFENCQMVQRFIQSDPFDPIPKWNKFISYNWYSTGTTNECNRGLDST